MSTMWMMMIARFIDANIIIHRTVKHENIELLNHNV